MLDFRSSSVLLRNQLHLYARDNLALVRIFLRDPYVTKLKRDEAFSIILFVAGAGGDTSRRRGLVG